MLYLQVDSELHRLLMEQKQSEGKLKKKSGTLLYLQNLQKEGQVNSICPICKNNLKGKVLYQCLRCMTHTELKVLL